MPQNKDDEPRGEHRDEGRIKYPSSNRRRRVLNIDEDPEWHAVATGKVHGVNF